MQRSRANFSPTKLFFLALAVVVLAACNSERKNDPTGSAEPSEQGNSAASSTDHDAVDASEVQHGKSQLHPNQHPFSWEQLRGWHTQGYVARDATIRIEFNQPIVDSSRIGKDASDVMLITPTPGGKPVFENSREIAWKPAQSLAPGISYKVRIKPQGLDNVPADAPPYAFSFQVIPLEFEIKIDSLAPEVRVLSDSPAANEPGKIASDQKTTRSQMWLKGELLVSDRVKETEVERVLKAYLQTQRLPVEWNHAPDGKKHRFQVRGIKRETFATDLLLKWDGSAIGIDSKGQREIAIPSSSDFKVLNVIASQEAGKSPHIRVDFSDLLDPGQNLKGLIKLGKKKFRQEISGHSIRIYPANVPSGQLKVTLSEGIKSQSGQALTAIKEETVRFDEARPQVRFIGNGSILPDNDTVSIPFEAVAANAVQVTAFEIYPDKVHQFLQVNRLSGDYETRRSGRYLWRKTIPLNPPDPSKWNRYSLDVSELMPNYKAGLLRLTLEILPQHASFNCPDGSQTAQNGKPMQNLEDNGVEEVSGWDGISDAVQQTNYYDYSWSERYNPCNVAYFRYNPEKVRDSQNFLASNIGLIAKQDSKGDLHVISTDLRTAEPMPGVELTVSNFQGQSMAQAKTDGAGFARIPLSATPFLLTASKLGELGYLKVNAKTALALSHFDVGGKAVEHGIKGAIYTERGVWRPGDALHLTFVVQDKSGDLPPDHPVTMTLTDPRGRVVDTQTHTTPLGGFYSFRFKTNETTPTGRYLVRAVFGGSVFTKALMIETVRPNRLKIDLSFNNGETLYASDGNLHGTLFSRWLHGASAANLKADIALKLRAKPTVFGRYDDYSFDDPARSLQSDDKILLAGRLDQQGYLKFDKSIQPATFAPGMLKATFTTRVFEQGGAFSISRNSFDYHPFRHYVGLKLPKGDVTRNMLLTDQDHRVEIASLSDRGEPVSLDQVQVSLYKIDWKWWWDKSGENLAAYAEGKNTGLLKQAVISTTDGKGEWRFRIDYPEWGRYLIRVCDLQGQHCAGKTVYIDWPGWAGRAQEEGGGAASRLDFFSDKNAYQVGETAVITLPATTRGRALLTVESGSEILQQRWVELGHKPNATHNDGDANQAVKQTEKEPVKKTETDSAIVTEATSASATGDSTDSTNSGVSSATKGVKASSQSKTDQTGKAVAVADKIRLGIPLTAAMAPNVYVHISLLQPHLGKQNDRPIRVYGIIPLEVSDPATHLEPLLATIDEWRPETPQTVEVSEASGREMTYTLAIVDEGLLGLTGFKTPDLHREFYSRERLGIKTWDLFDEVIGTYGGQLERLLAIGGGDEVETDNEDSKKRRFPPVVQFFGPFNLAAGDKAKHEVILPPYLGAVRLMLVAGHDGAYGKTDNEVTVKQPLMLQASLPRKLGPDETFSVPLNLFVMDDAIKSVQLQVKTDSLISVDDSASGPDQPDSRTIPIEQSGEKLAYVKLKTGKSTGKARLNFIASAQAPGMPEQRVESEIHIDILEPNRETTRLLSKVIEPGDSWQTRLEPFGLMGTNQAWLELSSVPSLNLEKHLDYLLAYPHGCIEQTTSAAFPQLFLDKVMALDEQRQRDATHHVNTAIDRLARFQQANGNFSYWPGADQSNDWASLYAGHFLIEAKALGYLVPDALLQDWTRYQIDQAQGYLAASKDYSHTQAYRLYVLARAGKPQLGAMNRLRESSQLNDKARWLLASAYQSASQPAAVDTLIQDLPSMPAKADTPDETFSSTLGNLGIRLDNLVTINKKEQANQLVEAIAAKLAGTDYKSTQGLAWALMGISRYLEGDTSSFSASLTHNQKQQTISSTKPHTSTRLVFPPRYQPGDPVTPVVQKGSPLSVSNISGIKLFATVVNQGVPPASEEQAMQQGLTLEPLLEYRQSEQGENWQTMKPAQPILRGSDIRLSVTVTNTSGRKVENVALTLPLASGLEMTSASEQPKPSKQYDHRELRDDRALYYFSLKASESKTFQVVANAAYLGDFYMPAIQVEAMYDGQVQARIPGFWLLVVKSLPAGDGHEGLEDDNVNNQAKDQQKEPQALATRKVSIDKAHLYHAAKPDAQSAMYLVKDDMVEILESTTSQDQKRWHRIRYVTKSGKVLEKWIQDDALD